MAKFRKKPVVIEAVQFRLADEVWPAGVAAPGEGERGFGYGYIDTLEGRMMVTDGDWIITGVAGEIYPCKDAIFRATYEAVEE